MTLEEGAALARPRHGPRHGANQVCSGVRVYIERRGQGEPEGLTHRHRHEKERKE